MAEYNLAVVGAGIVGTSTALWAAIRGLRVVLLDPAPPGSGTSSGNAGTIATYACLPVNDPAVIAGLPGLLFGADSPLAVDWVHALRHPVWMLTFLANCRRGPSRAIAERLALLLAHADAGLNPLIEAAGAGDLVVARGQLSVWSTRAGALAAEEGLARRAGFGIPFDRLTGGEAASLEPGLALAVDRAVHFTGARHLRDPEALVRRLHARFGALGGTTVAQAVTRVTETAAGVEVATGDTGLEAARVVIASGAFAARIRGGGAEGLPLGVERGHHLMFATEAGRVTRPVGWGEGGFYATPMAAGLRLAGTVELSSLERGPSRGRLAYLAGKGTQMLGPLPAPSAEWLGFRPTMPDSLPVLGHAPGSQRIIHAFGHQHLGLTLGGITGRIAVDLAMGRQPNFDIRDYDPGRRYRVRA